MGLGWVSLLADVVYEGARSVIGPFLATLGASAVVVGFAAGAGEVVAYGLRVFAGYWADRSRAYWALTILGYGLTVAAVPLLGLAVGVWMAVGLVVVERLGKAIRTPARDTILAEGRGEVGAGRAFGIHEALDQIGALAGPLLVGGMLAAGLGFRAAFGWLALPGVATLAVLATMARRYRRVGDAQPAGSVPDADAAPIPWAYLVFVLVATVGFVPFALVSYHWELAGVMPTAAIPVAFAVAMLVDAGAALLAGRSYDRSGLRVLAVLPLLSVAGLAVLSTRPVWAWAGIVAWGAALGLQESVMRAAAADLTSPGRRGAVFGLLGVAYGVGLLVAGVGLGALYQLGVGWVAAAVVVVEAAALVLLFTKVGDGRSPLR